MMPAYLRLQRTHAKVGPAVIELRGRRKFNLDLVSCHSYPSTSYLAKLHPPLKVNNAS